MSGSVAELVARRAGLLAELCDGPITKRDLVERVDASRSTVDRAIRRLEGADLVRREADGHVATRAGRLALERRRSFETEMAAIARATGLLEPLPPDADLPATVLRDADIELVDGPTSYAATGRLRRAVRRASRYRAALVTAPDPRTFAACREGVLSGETTARLALEPVLFDVLREEYRGDIAGMVAAGLSIRTGETPAYDLHLVETPDETLVAVVVPDGERVHGVCYTTDDAAVAWARGRLETVMTEGRDVTDRVDGIESADAGEEAPDGGVAARRNRTATEQLPVSLAPEGFVTLSRDQFATSSATEPLVAYRSGLSRTEVRAGYAAPRELDEDGRPLSAVLRDRLRAGESLAVLGAPGAGKSTVCRRTAVAWADEGDPVFYRSGGAEPFRSIDELRSACRDTAGRPLVVVEDATRADAAAVFDAMERVDEDAGTVFLLDARRREWNGRGLSASREAVRRSLPTVAVSPLDEAAATRLVERFESVVGVEVDATPPELLSAVRDEGGVEAGELPRLFHRLTNAAGVRRGDGDAPTSLEREVRETEDTLSDLGPAALDAGTLVATLVAAGLPVTRDAVLSVATAGDDGIEERREAVDAALAALEDRALFPDADDRGYRTVHESWAETFLSAPLDRLPESVARERFARSVGAYLRLADADARERVAALADGTPTLDRVERDPVAWTADTVSALTELLRRRYRPAVLFSKATADGPSPRLPAACPVAVRFEFREQVARSLRFGTRLDAAETEYHALLRDLGPAERRGDLSPREAVRLRVLAHTQLATVAHHRDDYATALDRLDRARALADRLDDDGARADCLFLRGRIANEQGRLDDAERHLERTVAVWEGDDTSELPGPLVSLGSTRVWQGDLDGAESVFQRALDLGHEHDDGVNAAEARHGLAWVSNHRGDLDDASTQLSAAIDQLRRIGAREKAARALVNLAGLEAVTGAFADASDRIETGRARSTDLGLEGTAILFDAVAGQVARYRGDTDRATALLGDAVTGLRDLGQTPMTLDALVPYARTALDEADPATARDRFESGLDGAREMGDPAVEAECLVGLARAAAMAGDVEDAEARLSAARETLPDHDQLGRARAARAAGEVATAAADHDRARAALVDATTAFRDCGALPDALDCLRCGVEACEAAGATADAVDRCEEGLALADRVDDAERWREWFRGRAGRLESDE